MRRTLLAVLLVALAVGVPLLAACSKDVPQGAIAAVGDGVVTQEQFDEIVAQAKAQYAAQGENAPAFPEEGTPQYNQLVASIVNYLVQNEIVAQKAAEMGLKVTAQELDERMKQIEQQVGGKKKLDELLEQQKVTAEQLRGQLEAQMLLEKVRARVYEDVKVDDAAAKAYFDDPKNEAQFKQEETREMRHVLVKTKARAAEAIAQLKQDPTSDKLWREVAREFSTDPGSKNKGGELGAWPKGRMVPEFDAAAFKLKVNELSSPVKSPFGWHVIQVTKVSKPKAQTFEEAKETIKQQLAFQEQAKAWEQWIKQATEEAEIVYAVGFNPDTLTTAPSPAPVSPAPSGSPAAGE
jgi:parvulin-like peptidyl-prolyl isomerase